MVFTILFTRAIVFIHNPNPIIFDFELHHFDYGMLLMMGASLILLLERGKPRLCLILIAVATGLIVDEYWFIRKSMVEDHATQTQVYNATFPSVVVLVIAVILFVYFINAVRKRSE